MPQSRGGEKPVALAPVNCRESGGGGAARVAGLASSQPVWEVVMIARVRTRLTYANVVATLALFVALGGTGYAAAKVTSGDIKNRTIKRVDIRKNTLTGTEIRESRLRRVPRARRADNAGTAQNALSASNANLASNAQAL